MNEMVHTETGHLGILSNLAPFNVVFLKNKTIRITIPKIRSKFTSWILVLKS